MSYNNSSNLQDITVSLLPEDFAALRYISDYLNDHDEIGIRHSKQDAVRKAIRAYEAFLKKNEGKKND